MLNSSEAVDRIVFLPRRVQQFKLDIFHKQTEEILAEICG